MELLCGLQESSVLFLYSNQEQSGVHDQKVKIVWASMPIEISAFFLFLKLYSFYSFILIDVCVFVCVCCTSVCVSHVYRCLQKPEDTGSPGTGVTGGYKSPDMGAEN